MVVVAWLGGRIRPRRPLGGGNAERRGRSGQCSGRPSIRPGGAARVSRPSGAATSCRNGAASTSGTGCRASRGSASSQAAVPARARPRPCVAPRRQRHHDDARVPGGQILRREPEPIQSAPSVAGDNDVRAAQQLFQGGLAGCGTEVDKDAVLAGQCVQYVQRHLGQSRSVQPHDVGAVHGQYARGDRTGDDTREIEHPHTPCGPGRCRSDDALLNQRDGMGDSVTGGPTTVSRSGSPGRPPSACHNALTGSAIRSLSRSRTSTERPQALRRRRPGRQLVRRNAPMAAMESSCMMIV